MRSLALAAALLSSLSAAPAQALPLERVFVVVAPGWDVIEEAPEQASDPALIERGFRSSVARHYTRARGPVSEVCTIELWRFEAPEQAHAAAQTLPRPEWRVHEVGAVLVLAHGMTLERGVGSRRGLVEGCAELLAETRSRAARSL